MPKMDGETFETPMHSGWRFFPSDIRPPRITSFLPSLFAKPSRLRSRDLDLEYTTFSTSSKMKNCARFSTWSWFNVLAMMAGGLKVHLPSVVLRLLKGAKICQYETNTF